MKKMFIFLAMSITALSLVSCGSDDENSEDQTSSAPSVVATAPVSNGTINAGESIKVTFDQSLWKNQYDGKVYVNDQSVDYTVSGSDVLITFDVAANAEYKIKISAGAVMNPSKTKFNEEYSFTVYAYKDAQGPTVTEQSIKDGELVSSYKKIILTYSEKVQAGTGKIFLNDKEVNFSISGNVLTVSDVLEISTSYTLKVEAGAVTDLSGNQSAELLFNFATKDTSFSGLCDASANSSAKQLYQFLINNFGSKTISGAMANIGTKQLEAGYCNTELGDYPALLAIDLIWQHAWLLNKSSVTWWQNACDYEDITQFVDHYNNGGMVAMSFHMNVPANQAAASSTTGDDFKYNNVFSVTNAVTDGTWENDFLKKLLDESSDYIKLFSDKGIPILFRPLHEAAGQWFWWGYDGKEAFITLWKYVYNYYTNTKGLHNLIWVYTAAWKWESGLTNVSGLEKNADWYPGDDYVDVVAFDQYGGTADETKEIFNLMTGLYPGKIITQGECGNNQSFQLATITEQINAGATWSWIMPWYKADCANLSETDLGLDWWSDAYSNDKVLWLDDMPGWQLK